MERITGKITGEKLFLHLKEFKKDIMIVGKVIGFAVSNTERVITICDNNHFNKNGYYFRDLDTFEFMIEDTFYTKEIRKIRKRTLR